jgi:hypothetical protein
VSSFILLFVLFAFNNLFMKKNKQLGIRVTDSEMGRLMAVQDNIALGSRGQRPDLVEIIRSILGWGNKELVSENERKYLAGDTDSLHGEHPPISRSKPLADDRERRKIG